MNINTPLEMILPNPWQIHTGIDANYALELAGDIATNGLLQVPIGRLVNKDGTALSLSQMSALPLNDHHMDSLEASGIQVQLAFGHHRLAAYRENRGNRGASWGRMPVEIRVLSNEQMAIYAWAENDKHHPPTAIEEALAIQKRIDDFGWTHEDVAANLNISRSAVSNKLRLLKLPEDIQAKLADGLAERSAVALLSLFALPEFIRKEADKQIEYSWDTRAAETMPSRIVAGALAGESSETTRQRIDKLIEKYGEKLSGAPWKYGDDFRQLVEGIELPENLSLNGIRSFACSACELRQEKHICLDKACFAMKRAIWNISLLHKASQASGIPYLEHEEANRYPRSDLDRYGFSKYAESIVQSGCENLRLVHTWLKAEKNGPDTLEGHPYVRIICQKRTGSCSCLQGLEAQERAAQSRPALQTEPVEAASPEEPGGTTRPSATPDSKELEEAARAARREKKASLERIPAVKAEFAGILAKELIQFNAELWKSVIRRIHFKSAEFISGKKTILEDISDALANALIETRAETYYGDSQDPAGMVRRSLERYLADARSEDKKTDPDDFDDLDPDAEEESE